MNPMRSRLGVISVITCLVVAMLYGCMPPRRTLSEEEKIADMYWLYSQFNENYAPLEYKESRYGYKYDELKQKYLGLAKATQSNDEFYKVMYNFVSEFRDAHTSASMGQAELPARTKVAYLGFLGKRKGNNLLVTEYLPTVARDSARFPVKVGDQIVKMDGKDMKTMVADELVGYRNLGQEESNLTYHMGKLLTRVSTSNGLPKSESVKLTLLRGTNTVEVELPWIVKDIVTFSGEQRKASSDAKAPIADLATFNPADFFKIGMMRMDGKLELATTALSRFVQNLPSYNFWNSFTFVDSIPAWIEGLQTVTPKMEAPTVMTMLRNVPANAVFIDDAKTYPVYITREDVVNTQGQATGQKKFVAYMLLWSFSPGAGGDQILAELKATFAKLSSMGVNDLVIDMVNNGGGSLVLGMQLAQFFSNTKIAMSEIQYRISESWLDEFEKNSLSEGTNDAEREINRRLYNQLLEDKAAGKRLSRKFNVESLIAFPLDPNPEMKEKLNIVLMVNEMCASMCDIFTAMMKDNGMAKVVGSKTMGAGGNVVEHMSAPNSNLTVRQTESLILRRDGTTYIENNGIEPDVALNVNESVDTKYDEVRRKALSLLLTDTTK